MGIPELFMKPKLYIRKTRYFKNGKTVKNIYFSVVDADSSYPQNFICILPASTDVFTKGYRKSCFTDIFGNKSLKLAKTLLAEALSTEPDPDAVREVEKRLRRLDSVELQHQSSRIANLKNWLSPACSESFQQNLLNWPWSRWLPESFASLSQLYREKMLFS